MNNTFDLKITFNCNNNCRHCVVADKRNSPSISLEEIFSIIDRIPSDTTAIQITGGEPSIYPHFLDILKKCKDRCLYVVVQSNGTGFCEEGFAKECSKYIDHAHIAIHSHSPEVHDNIVACEGMWEKTIQGFKNLVNAGVYVTSQTVITKYNIENLYDTFQFIQSLKEGTRMSMTYPHLMGNAFSNKDEVAFRYIDHRDVIQKVLKDFHKVLFVEAIPYCHLHPYGHMVATLEKDMVSSIGRIGIDYSNSKTEIKDYNTLNLEEYRKAPLCKYCMYDKYCIGVWKEYIETFKDKLDLYPIVIED